MEPAFAAAGRAIGLADDGGDIGPAVTSAPRGDGEVCSAKQHDFLRSSSGWEVIRLRAVGQFGGGERWTAGKRSAAELRETDLQASGGGGGVNPAAARREVRGVRRKVTAANGSSAARDGPRERRRFRDPRCSSDLIKSGDRVLGAGDQQLLANLPDTPVSRTTSGCRTSGRKGKPRRQSIPHSGLN